MSSVIGNVSMASLPRGESHPLAIWFYCASIVVSK